MGRNLRYSAITLSLVLAGVLLIPALSPGMALQEKVGEESFQRTLNVSGSGQVSAQPDVAVVTLGVQTEAPT